MYSEKQDILAPVLPQITDTLDKLNRRPTKLFKSLVSKKGDRLVGYVSGLRAYRSTWLSQHLAGAAGAHTGPLLNVGLAEYFGQDPDVEYCKVYFRPENRWPARVFGNFARKVSDPWLSDLRTYQYFNISTDLSGLGGSGAIRVVEAQPGDLTIVEQHFVTTERGLLIRSDDLTRANLELRPLNESYRELGLERRRHVLLALDRDTPVAFALAEISSPGLNLSELLSAFRIHYLASEHDRIAQAHHELMAAALRFYRDAGRPFAVALALPEQVADYERAGLTSHKRYTCWTCYRPLGLRFSEHVEYLVNTLIERQRRRSRSLSSSESEQASDAPKSVA
jgi:hypothetical protein